MNIAQIIFGKMVLESAERANKANIKKYKNLGDIRYKLKIVSVNNNTRICLLKNRSTNFLVVLFIFI